MKKTTKKTKDKPEENTHSEESIFPIVGIGASAGGLKAIETFFKAIPSDTEVHMAFVLVQHLDPTHKSILVDLVKQYSKMPVSIVEDGIQVKPDCVYVIPPNRDMALVNGKLQLIEPESPHGFRLPIDYFFRTLADDQHEKAICIILSGTGTDGTLGLKAIKGEGGLAIVQSPESAQYDGMPRSAINTGMSDFILSPEQMPEQLKKYVSHSFKNNIFLPSVLMPKSEDTMKRIFMLLRNQTGHDFSNYKQNTIRRRIERRMVVNQIEHLDDYYKYIKNNPIEIETLFRELLIGVTNFFRDIDAYKSLSENVIGKFLTERDQAIPVRIWVPGCSTGEEAYSLAILFHEYIEKTNQNFTVQIFATDIDSEAVEKARSGLYPESVAADIPKENLSKYFIKENNSYRIHKTIRDMVVFAKQDIIKDPPFSKLDMISCRNLLIYLGSELQKKIIPLFHYALKPDGCLLLGNSETIGEFNDLFSAIDKKWKIYIRKGTTTFQQNFSTFTLPLIAKLKTEIKPMTSPKNSKTEFHKLIEQTLLESYAPPCVIINPDFEILYIQGKTGKFLEPATGEASMNLSRMIREGLKMELHAGLRKVISTKSSVRYDGLKVKNNGNRMEVNLILQPIKDNNYHSSMIMVIFEETKSSRDNEKPIKGENVTDKNQRITELERDLQTKGEYLQTSIEELETTNEELKSTNEELQSANEELQSTNEELETSKEELQSVNEELVTVNMELQKKIEELTMVSNDMNNLMAGTGIATIFVDHDLNIQRFTPAATQIINFINTDVGRSVAHIVSKLVNYNSLIEDLKSVLSTLIPKEAEVQTKALRWYLMRIQPYRTLNNVIEGAVLTFVDITEQKQIQNRLKEAEEKLKIKS